MIRATFDDYAAWNAALLIVKALGPVALLYTEATPMQDGAAQKRFRAAGVGAGVALYFQVDGPMPGTFAADHPDAIRVVDILN